MTELISFIHNFIRFRLFGTAGYYGFLCYLAKNSRLFLDQALDYLWLIARDLYCLCSLVIYIVCFIIVISFIKSLKPKFNFCHEQPITSGSNKCTHQSFSQPTNGRAMKIVLRKDKTVEQNKSLLSKFGTQLSTRMQRVFSSIRSESRRTKPCSPLLSLADIQAVYHQLPWSSTHIDLESLKWLNQSLDTLWPSVKTALNRFVFDDILKKPDRKKVLNKNLSTKQAKLSFYISSLRKLDQLRKEQTYKPNKYTEFIDRSSISVLVYFVKSFFIYTKQFLMDFIGAIFKKSVNQESTGAKQLSTLGSPKSDHKSPLKQIQSRPQLGSDLPTNEKGRTQIKATKRMFTTRSAPTIPSTNGAKKVVIASSALLGPNMSARLRQKRLKLATLFEKTHISQQNREITFQKIELGNKIPTIQGIKYIEEVQDMLREHSRFGSHLMPSDNENIRLIIEIGYSSDKQFRIRLKSIPILDEIGLTKFSFQLRFLITLNHTTSELNKNLSIFDTPVDALFPIINHVQLTLVDVPKIDWELKRPRRNNPDKRIDRKGKYSRLLVNASNFTGSYLKKFLDPIYLINHAYVKYLAHTIARLVLRWFQPFDIKIGDQFYIKTSC